MKKGMKLPELSLSCDSKTAVAKFEVFSCGLLLARTRGLNIPGQEGNFDHCGSCGSLSLPRKGIFPKLQGKALATTMAKAARHGTKTKSLKVAVHICVQEWYCSKDWKEDANNTTHVILNEQWGLAVKKMCSAFQQQQKQQGNPQIMIRHFFPKRIEDCCLMK
jgi:hypothetical protein